MVSKVNPIMIDATLITKVEVIAGSGSGGSGDPDPTTKTFNVSPVDPEAGGRIQFMLYDDPYKTGKVDTVNSSGVKVAAYSFNYGASATGYFSKTIDLGTTAGTYTSTVTYNDGTTRSIQWVIKASSSGGGSGGTTPGVLTITPTSLTPGASLKVYVKNPVPGGNVKFETTYNGATFHSFTWGTNNLGEFTTSLTAGMNAGWYSSTATFSNGTSETVRWSVTAPVTPVNSLTITPTSLASGSTLSVKITSAVANSTYKLVTKFNGEEIPTLGYMGTTDSSGEANINFRRIGSKGQYTTTVTYASGATKSQTWSIV